jgi:transposase-like protein
MSSQTFPVQNLKDYTDIWEKFKDRVPFNATINEINCVFCNSKDIIRYGHLKNKQCWWCKHCHRKFTEGNILPGMRIPFKEYSLAVRMYFSGVPLKIIRRQLWEEYGYSPSAATIYKWIYRIINGFQDECKRHRIKVGNTWIAYETPIMIRNRKYWILDIVDTYTCFLLATKLSRGHDISDIKLLIELARDKAGVIPKKVLTNRLNKYREGLVQAVGTDANWIKIEPYIKDDAMECSLLEERLKVISRHRLPKAIELILKGWQNYHNYGRPNEAINNETPAQKAGINIMTAQYLSGPPLSSPD